MDEGPVAATLVEYYRVNRTGLAVVTLVIVVPLAAFATDGPWRVLLICGAVVGGIGYAALGPSIRLDLRDGHLLRRFMTRRTDLDLVGVTEVDVFWIPYARFSWSSGPRPGGSSWPWARRRAPFAESSVASCGPRADGTVAPARRASISISRARDARRLSGTRPERGRPAPARRRTHRQPPGRARD
jgi:hypothetical protein